MSCTVSTAKTETNQLDHHTQEVFQWVRPDSMQGVNLLRLEDLDERGAPFVVPQGSELDIGLQRMLDQAGGGFKRCDLPGPQQFTHWNLTSVCDLLGTPDRGADQLTLSHLLRTRPARYKFDRATYNSKGNLACRAPGQAILALQNVYDAEYEDRIAVWVLLPQRAARPDERETRFPFGVYRTYWNGAAEPGEFDAVLLSPDHKEPIRDGWQKQNEVLGAHEFYTKGTLSEYARWMYENTLIEKREGPAEIGVQVPPTNDTEEQEISAAT